MLDTSQRRSTCPHWTNSTLPPSEKGGMHQPHLITEEHKFSLHRCFRKDVCNLLIYGNILELDYSLLDPVSEEMISDVDMLGLIMEDWLESLI